MVETQSTRKEWSSAIIKKIEIFSKEILKQIINLSVFINYLL